jgi:hypothetical protein
VILFFGTPEEIMKAEEPVVKTFISEAWNGCVIWSAGLICPYSHKEKAPYHIETKVLSSFKVRFYEEVGYSVLCRVVHDRRIVCLGYLS